MSRGIEKRDVFLDQNDVNKYLFYLRENIQRYDVVLYAYALMENHFHLFFQTQRPNLSRFMHDLNTAYTVYFNTKRQRVGPLFQGRYRSIIVERDTYMLELTRYIHLNPVRSGAVERPEDYLWSSYRQYTHGNHDEWVNTEWAQERFGSGWRKEYRKFVNNGFDASNPLDDVVAGCILGCDVFVDAIKTKLSEKNWDNEVPSLKILKRITIEEVIQAASQYFSVDPAQVTARSREFYPRKIAIYLARKHCGIHVSTIGSVFSIGNSAVSKLMKRMISERKADPELDQAIANIEKVLLCA
jgi:putative transposase